MVSEFEQRPTLVLNPPDDDAFRASAEQLVESGIVEPSILEDRLRQRWPLALVRPRELAGEQAEMWYVYREGHWVGLKATSDSIRDDLGRQTRAERQLSEEIG